MAWQEQGQVVTLVVDGALSTTTWFLNGERILVQNPVGYLPTVLRLDVTFGKPNVLACYVDGGQCPLAAMPLTLSFRCVTLGWQRLDSYAGPSNGMAW